MPDTTALAPRERRALLGAAALMAATITLVEVVLFNALIFVSHYVNASLTIGLVLLGMSLGGVVASWLSRRGRFGVVGWALAASVGVLVLVAALFALTSSILWGVLVLVLPFFFAATLIAIAFVRLPSWQVYAADLAGAALGVALAGPALVAFREEGALVMAAALPLLAVALLTYASGHRLRSGAALIAGLAVIAAATLGVQQGWLNLASHGACRSDRAKVFCMGERKSKGWQGATLLASASHLIGRIDVVQRTGGQTAKTFLHGYVADTVSKAQPKAYRWDVRIPWGYIKDPATLVIGLSAQGVSKTARGLGDGPVTGVELSPVIADLMFGELYERSGRAYDDIDVHVLDGRTYVETTDKKFDIITLMNAHRGRNADYLGGPEHLMTVEAFEAYLDHLNPRGVVVIEELVTNKKRSRFASYKLVETALEALRRDGAADPFRHILAYHWFFDALYVNVLISKTPFTADDVAKLRTWVGQVPGKGWTKSAELTFDPTNPNTKGRFARAITNRHRLRVAAAKGRVLRPTTDDRPFPTHMYRWAPDFLKNLGLALLLAILLILLPATILLGRGSGAAGKGKAVDLGYFGLVGLGYMVVEIALIHRYQLYLGSPAYAFVAVLGSMLLASGAGGWLLRSASPRRGRLACAGVAVGGLATYLLLGPLFAASQGLPLAVRLLITVLTVTPLGFLMGAPLPCAMTAVRRRRGDSAVPVAYAAAGALGVVGTSLAYWLAVVVGFQVTAFVGLGAYALAALLAVRVFTVPDTSDDDDAASPPAAEPTDAASPPAAEPSEEPSEVE